MKLIPMTTARPVKSDLKSGRNASFKMQRDIMDEFMKPLLLFLRGLCLNPRGSVHYKLLMKENIRRAFREKNDSDFDYSRILVSKGKLPVPRNISVESEEPGSLMFSWNDNSGRRGAYWTDRLFVALYHYPSEKWVFELEAADRYDGSFNMDVYGMEGQTVHIYAGFVCADRLRVSTSVYLGCKQIERVVPFKRA